MIDIHEETFRICTWDVDRADRLTMAAAYNFCQEVAGNHAAALGVGGDFMKRNGIVWILSRMSAVLESRPGSGSSILVRTWPLGTERLFAIREYELADGNGVVFGRGRSAWLIVDAETYRPRRPEAIVAGLPLNEGREALPGGAAGLDAVPGLAVAGTRAVAYSDLDYNGHMNNARYVQWIQDVIDPGLLADATSMRLDLNYLAELRPGTAARLCAGDVDAGAGWGRTMALEGSVADDQARPSFRALLSLGY